MVVWKRPSNMPFPSVWLRFKAKDLESDNLVEYRIQDCPEDRFEDVIQHLLENYIPDENMCRRTEIHKHTNSLNEFLELWRNTLQQKMGLVCFRDGSDEIVGCNMLAVFTDDKEPNQPPKYPVAKILFNAFKIVSESVDVFDKYKVDKYITAFGLSVGRKYRGRGISIQILKGRVPLGKATGVPLTTTVFTSPGSQVAADRAGFVTDAIVTYEELEKDHGIIFPGNTVKELKLMSLRIE